MRRGQSLHVTYSKRFPKNPPFLTCVTSIFFSELIKSQFQFVKVKFELCLNDIVSISTCIKEAKLLVSDQCATGGTVNTRI